MIGAIESNRECRARAAGCSLEPRVGGDHIVGENRAIAPAADSQSIRIGYAHLQNLIDSGLQILDFVMTPVGKDRARMFLAAARTAAIVHRQHGVAIRGEDLPLDAERMLILTVGTAVNSSNRGTLVPFT